MNTARRTAVIFGAFASLAASAHAQGKVNHYGNPEKVAPAPTTGAITVRDLQIRLYQYADDSMQGRQIGRIGNKKATDYIASELKRLKVAPAGDNGTYFQLLPYHFRLFTNHSRLQVDGNPLAWEKDWLATPGTQAPRPIAGVPVIFGGTIGDTTNQVSAAQAAGKFVVVLPAPPSAAPAGFSGRGGGRGGFVNPLARFTGAVAVATVDLDALSPAARAQINQPVVATAASGGRGLGGRAGQGAPADSLAILHAQINQLAPQANIRLTRSAAAALFGKRSVETLTAGTAGGTVTASLDYVVLPSDNARNVVGIIPGSDPVLKNEYVAIGAHNDHVGMRTPVDKDSLKAFNDIRNRLLIANKMVQLDQQQLGAIRVNMDSIRKIHPKPRLDSIANGADDDGSGSMAVLEIAEHIASMQVKPKRSTLFVWHTGEEAGLLGSAYYVANPTVPLDSIVAQINIDMIGRGRADDLPGGGDDYLAVVGSYFDSKDLGDQVADANKKLTKPFRLDYQFDSTTTWSGYNNIYGRSDHFNYARAGIPIAFFFTGLHGDYHQPSDEPEYIDYPHYAAITNYIGGLLVNVANGPRPRINGARPAKPPKPQP